MTARQSKLALDNPGIGKGPVCLKANKASIIIPRIEVFSRQKLVQEKISHRENRSEGLKVGMLKYLFSMEKSRLLFYRAIETRISSDSIQILECAYHMRPDKESSRNGIVLLILTVKGVFVHVAKFCAHYAKALFVRKSQCCEVGCEDIERREGGGCSIVSFKSWAIQGRPLGLCPDQKG